MALRRAMSCATFTVGLALTLGAPPALAHGGQEHGAPVRPPGGTYGTTHDHGASSSHDNGSADTSAGHTHGVATTGSGPDRRTRLTIVLGFIALNLTILSVAAFVRAYRPPRAARPA